MKKLLFTIAVALCCCNLALAEKQSVTVLKTDIHCDNCKNKILQNTDALGKGIKDVKVDLQSQIVFIEYDGELNSEENIIKGLESLNIKAEKARPVKGAANGKPFCKMPPPEKKAQKCDKADLAKCDKKAPDCGNKADCDKTIKCDKKADCEAKVSSCSTKTDCCKGDCKKEGNKCCAKTDCCNGDCKKEGNKCCGKTDCCPDMKCNK